MSVVVFVMVWQRNGRGRKKRYVARTAGSGDAIMKVKANQVPIQRSEKETEARQ
jgi:hypothetical protein